MNKLMITLVTFCTCMLFVGASQDTQAGPPMARGGHAMKGHAVKGHAVKGHAVKGHAVKGHAKKHAGHLALHQDSRLLRRTGHPTRAFGYGLGGYGYGLGGFGYGLGGFGGGYADGLSLYRNGQIPVPPYFSLHPPVYYSAPVARSYGLTPFPYPGDVPSPAVEEVPQPAVVENPYASPIEKNAEEEKPLPTDDSVAQVAPEMILNPYVDRTVHDDEIHVAKTDE